MSGGAIWWGQIGNSLRFLTNVTNTLQDCRSAVLQVPESIPWRHTFYEAIDIRRSSFSGERRLVRVQWEKDGSPGEFVLNELCSVKIQANYWPGQTYAEYLASLEDIILNDYYVWVSGIHDKTDLQKWVEFVSQYTHYSQYPENKAVFILEYDGPAADTAGIPIITYLVEFYDCRVFCLETAAALQNTDIQNYQAELALCIGENDPEFCDALLHTGKDLLSNPVQATVEVTSREYSSEGIQFSTLDEQQIQSSAWEAAIVQLFPVLERYRMDFIQKHAGKLKFHLPISNSNGDWITDPFDLEIGGLFYIICNDAKQFKDEDIDALRLCRKVRNLLAHNKVPLYSDVVKVINLKY